MGNLKCELTYLPEVSYALYQNYVPIVRELLLTNEGNTALENLELSLSIDSFGRSPYQQKIALLGAHETLHFTDDLHTLSIDPTAILQRTERVDTVLRLTIQDVTGTTLYSELFPIALLPFDYALQIDTLPEMLAAFVTPNYPAIAPILQRASHTLFQWTNNGSFDGYQSGDPNRVRKMMASVYYAIVQEQIIYSALPPSYEKSGQRIRMCDTLFTQRMANCIEISLLYAACLEAIDLHPLLLLLPGHAMAGAWLVESCFSHCVVDDVALVAKLAASGIHQIELLEATLMLKDLYDDFDASVDVAHHRISTLEQLSCIDIKRCRQIPIRPMPQRIPSDTGFAIIEPPKKATKNGSAPNELRTATFVEGEPQIGTKQNVWERKLLDLSLRNPLINTRSTRNMLPFLSVNLGELENHLADRAEFTILPQPEEWGEGMQSKELFRVLNADSPISVLVNNELKVHRLYARYKQEELNTAVVHLYRAARISMEENGANSLYLALGMLRWYESETSDVARYAPVILLPVELLKKSSRQGYVLRSRDEDTLINITLLEKLRQDFGINIGGLDPLPRDEHGVDITLIFSTIRMAVMAQKRWDIEEVALVGLFSFSKFVMWNDLHNNAEKLARNKVVQCLLAQKNIGIETLPELPDFDAVYKPADVALPVSADAYQLGAVVAATSGKSFILHGPPGTGKSQTITNIIANALYHGQKVLFVAEKMAALSVVQKRLNQIGLEAFCLELFSNKASKTEVLRQLQASADIAQYQQVENYAAESERLLALREELAGFVKLMHKPLNIGFSLYEAIGRYLVLAAQLPKVPLNFTIVHPNTLTAEEFAELGTELEKTQATVQVCGSIATHPLVRVGEVNYTPLLEQEAKERLSELLQHIAQFLPTYQGVTTTLLGDNELSRATQLEQFAQLITILQAGKEVLVDALRAEQPQEVLKETSVFIEHGLRFAELKTRLLSHYDQRLLEEDVLALERDWYSARTQWFLPKYFASHKFRKQLSFYRRHHTPIANAEVPALLEDLRNYHAEYEYIIQQDASKHLGKLWKGDASDWELLSSALETTQLLVDAIVALVGNVVFVKADGLALASALANGLQNFLALHQQELQAFVDGYKKLRTLQLEVARLLDFTLPQPTTDYIKFAQIYYEKLRENLDKLRDWENWLAQRTRLEQKGYTSFIQSIETGEVLPERLKDTFLLVFYQALILEAVSAHPQLAHFNSALFEQEIERFRKLSERFEHYTQLELFARLAASLPAMQTDANSNSELGFLQRNLRNNGRGVPLRKLFEGLRKLLPRLKPCMLMSPISVAQYIDLDAMKFDLVIFDEASQLPTCEAVAAIARGENVVVVGDPNQMPPTQFFVSNKEDEENLELEDLESILDDCLALPLPSRHLLCHYRSKHESLIAFSNAKFYENRLLTFPSPDDRISKVSFHQVKGVYDRGRTRTNVAEAQAVVEAVMEHLADPSKRMRSLGIVTFSVPQQNMVEDLLSAAFAAHPELEAQDAQSSEPIFVKNLENVQGDERDVIFFSVGYGADAAGYVSHNFGPLNQKGGWRRLNVAITRARYEMVIYSTLHYDQIDLKRTQAEGVLALRAFLEFAEKGHAGLKTLNNALRNESHSTSIVELIAAALRARGYQLDTQIGCSDYRIDIAIIDDAEQGEYLLGIVCDGENYQRAKTVADREITHPKVLHTLGWRILRIWALDWLQKCDEVLQKIETAIAEARTHKAVASKGSVSTAQPDNTEETLKAPKLVTVAAQQITSAKIAYNEIELSPVQAPSEAFTAAMHKHKVIAQIRQIVNTEAPVHKEYVVRKVIAAWGISRVGSKISAYLDSLFAELAYPTMVYDDDCFFWLPEQNPATHATYRSFHNQPNYIPPEEIAVAAQEVLRQQGSLPHDDLLREVAHLLGFSRLTPSVVTALERGVSKQG